VTKSLIRSVVNLARPIPFADKWNVRGDNIYGSGLQDRFTQIQAMGGNGTLFAIIQLLSAGGASSTGWKLFRKTMDGRVRYATSDKGSDQRKEIPSEKHWAIKLWNRPNPFMTGAMFREVGWQFMELVGEWYWVLNRGPSGTGVPIEMWPVRPDRMEPVPHKDKFLAGWVYTGPNGEAVPLSTDEVIQIKYPNPTDFYRGMSAVQALLTDLDAAKYTAEWSRNFFLNSATPGGIVQFAKRLTDEEFNEFTARWREQHQGVARGHRVGVLEQGATWFPNTYTLKDMQFKELRELSRDVIREAYRIHQAMLGISTDVNRANAQTAEEVHIRWHEVTRLVRQRMVLNEIFLPMFGSTSVGVEFDFDDPNPASIDDANDELTAKANALAKLVAAGYDPADACEVVGLPEMRYVGPPTPAVAGTSGGATEPEPAPRTPPQPSNAPAKNPQLRPAPGARDNTIIWDDIGPLIEEAFAEAKLSLNHNGHKELV
jgi:HK97 family phage portal protein